MVKEDSWFNLFYCDVMNGWFIWMLYNHYSFLFILYLLKMANDRLFSKWYKSCQICCCNWCILRYLSRLSDKKGDFWSFINHGKLYNLTIYFSKCNPFSCVLKKVAFAAFLRCKPYIKIEVTLQLCILMVKVGGFFLRICQLLKTSENAAWISLGLNSKASDGNW
jgi:hypothetical protein